MDEEIKKLENELVFLVMCIDFDNGTEHDELLLTEVIEIQTKLNLLGWKPTQ